MWTSHGGSTFNPRTQICKSQVELSQQIATTVFQLFTKLTVQTDSELAQVPESNCTPAQNTVHQIEATLLEGKRAGESDKALFSWEPLQLTSCWHRGLYATVSVLIFPRAHELCGSLLCQGFLAKILICLPSRLQPGCSFVWTRTVRTLGKGFLGIISIPGYSQPFLVIQYQNNTLYSCTPPCSSKSTLLMRLLLHLSISILTSYLNTLPVNIFTIFL